MPGNLRKAPGFLRFMLRFNAALAGLAWLLFGLQAAVTGDWTVALAPLIPTFGTVLQWVNMRMAYGTSQTAGGDARKRWLNEVPHPIAVTHERALRRITGRPLPPGATPFCLRVADAPLVAAMEREAWGQEFGHQGAPEAGVRGPATGLSVLQSAVATALLRAEHEREMARIRTEMQARLATAEREQIAAISRFPDGDERGQRG